MFFLTEFPHPNRVRRRTQMKSITILFGSIAERAGYVPGADGKLNLPATQETADRLAEAATATVGGDWSPGEPVYDVTLSGPGPVWGYLAIAHALHGRVPRLRYSAPNADITVWSHGVDAPERATP